MAVSAAADREMVDPLDPHGDILCGNGGRKRRGIRQDRRAPQDKSGAEHKPRKLAAQTFTGRPHGAAPLSACHDRARVGAPAVW